MDAGSCVGVLELGNRLCLPRLISLTEEVVIARLTEAIEDGCDVTDEALKILQPCQVSVSGLLRCPLSLFGLLLLSRSKDSLKRGCVSSALLQ